MRLSPNSTGDFSKQISKSWKNSPPTRHQKILSDLPVQQCRLDVRVQQARNQLPLELFEPSPKYYRDKKGFDAYYGRHHHLKFGIKPKNLSNFVENGERNQNSSVLIVVFSLLVSTAVTLNLIAHQMFMSTHDDGNGKYGSKAFWHSESIPFFRSTSRSFAKSHPRVFFDGKGSCGGLFDSAGAFFESIPGREIRLYPAEFTDVSQLYSITSSDDSAISSSMEMRSFPKHESRADCVPMHQWQMKSFRELYAMIRM